MLTSVVTIMRFAANTSLPPMDFTIMKLAVAVGLTNSKNNTPRDNPVKPNCQASNVTTSGNSNVFSNTASTVSVDEDLSARRFMPAPHPNSARGNAS